jgi:hypothetical protein
MSAILPDDLLLPDDDLAPVDGTGETSQPVTWPPARSGHVADPREDGVVVP